MPIPTPNIDETNEDFIDRCMSDEIMVEDFEDEKQRLAVCNTQLENKKNNNNMEKRIFNVETRVDSTEDGKEVVVGYASVYDSRSNNLGGFYEYIEQNAFSEELINSSDVRALINHDASLIMARSKNGVGTLNLRADEKGLRYEFEIEPELSYAKDLAISLKRGDISQSSFAFTVAPNGDEWSTDADGNNIRTIKKIDMLYDISAVTYPAYSQADSDLVVAKRGLKEYQESLVEETKEEIIEEKENNLVRNSLISLNIELKKRK
jgi:HK97 family phage prohead protease